MNIFEEMSVVNGPQFQKLHKIRRTNRTISVQEGAFLLDHLPIIRKNQTYRNAVIWLSKGSHIVCDDTGGIMLPYWIIADWAEKDSKKINTENILINIKRDVDPYLIVLPYSWQRNRCRVIMETGLKAICDALLEDLALDRIYTNTWTAFSERRYQDNLRAQKTVLQNITAPYPVQNKLMGYLNSLPCWLFQAKEEHLRNAFAVAKSLDEKHTEEMKKKWENNPKKLARIEVNRNRKLLHQFIDDRHPHYLPSQQFGSMTYRIFGYVLPVMTGDVVKALFPYWAIADLKNCHLAVFASRFNMPDTKALMAHTDDIFMEVVKFMGIKTEHQEKARKLLKATVYAMICGMSLPAAQARLTRELNENGIGYRKRFMHHFLAKELASAVEQAREQIKEKNGIEGAYGWMKYSPGMKIDSFIACWLQSFEMALNEPCYNLAISTRESHHETHFYITNHQHDGFSFFSESRDMEVISEQLTSAVKSKAEELKINTSLVIK